MEKQFDSFNINVLKISFKLKENIYLSFFDRSVAVLCLLGCLFVYLVCLSVCGCACSCVCLCVCFSVCVLNSCSTLRVSRAETRLTVYRSSYIILK